MNKKPFTKEQEKEMENILKEHENITVFTCGVCKEKLVGMLNVRRHVDGKQHYEYIDSTCPKLRICVG